jgi:hypothetical protein
MHRNATPWRERWAGRAPELEAVSPGASAGPPIAVTVVHDDGHVTVSFDIPRELEGEWAGQLTLAVNSAAGPTARVYDVTVPGVQESV